MVGRTSAQRSRRCGDARCKGCVWREDGSRKGKRCARPARDGAGKVRHCCDYTGSTTFNCIVDAGGHGRCRFARKGVDVLESAERSLRRV